MRAESPKRYRQEAIHRAEYPECACHDDSFVIGNANPCSRRYQLSLQMSFGYSLLFSRKLQSGNP